MLKDDIYVSDESVYDEIFIPKINYGDNDSKLLERVIKLKKGSIRIAVFMLVGLIMGWFSYTYTQDTFIITKAILCIPYKISEAIYTSIIGTDAINNDTFFSFWFLNDYFPQSVTATFLAERVTPVFIGMIGYGSLAYFTGDKRVFTLQRFVKFVSIQICVLGVFIAAVYGVNAKAVSDNNQFKDVEEFYLSSEQCSETVRGKKAEILVEKFYQELQKEENIVRNMEEEIRIGVIAANSKRWMEAYVHPEQSYIVTHGGVKYRVSKEFTDYVREYEETGRLQSMEIMIGE